MTGRRSRWRGAAAWIVIAASAYWLAGPTSRDVASAHELPVGRGTQSTFRFLDGELEIELNYGMSAPFAIELKTREIDASQDGVVSENECRAFLDRAAKELVQKMEIRLNGERITPVFESSREAGIQGPVLNLSCDAYFVYKAKLPTPLEDGGWWLHYRDDNFQGEENTTTYSWVKWRGNAPNTNFIIFDPIPDTAFDDYRTIGRTITLFFDFDHHPDILPTSVEPPDPDTLLAEREQRIAAAAAKHAAETEPVETPTSTPTSTPSEIPEIEREPENVAARVELFATIGVFLVIAAGIGTVFLVRRSKSPGESPPEVR